MSEWWNEISAWMQKAWDETVMSGPHWLLIILEIIAIFAVAKLLAALASRAVRAFMRMHIRRAQPEKQRRLDSLSTLTHSILRYVIYFSAAVLALSLVGLKSMGSVITTAGIGGIALGIGAQSVVKDIVTGFLLLFENQFHVGEYVEIAGIKGTVQAITIRVTYIRGGRGELHVIPNGRIDTVVNYSRGPYQAIMDIGIAYEEDIERALAALNEVAAEYALHSTDITEPPQVLGTVSIDERSVILRVTAQSIAPQHALVERELLRLAKERFDRDGIELPYPHRVLLRPNEVRRAPGKSGVK